MTHTVQRLAVRCRGDGSTEKAAGATERRLRRIASNQLPTALDAMLPDLDLKLGRLVVPVHFSVADHDDETVAWLWASAITSAVERHAASARLSPVDTTAVADSETLNAAAEASAIARQIGEALELILPDGADGSQPAVLRKTLLEVLAAIPPHQRHAAQELLRSAIRASGSHPAWSPVTQSDGAIATSSEPARISTPRTSPSFDQLSVKAWTEVVESELRELSDMSMSTFAKELDLPGSGFSKKHEEEARTDTSILVSGVAGVVLLYPWLGRLVEQGWELHGKTPEVALATLLAVLGDRPVSPHDPLLGVLAGVANGDKVDMSGLVSLDMDPLASAIDEMYERFVSLLPGSWSVDALVDDLVIRRGSLRHQGDVWLLEPERRPLDILLVRLPYPVTSFSFAWTDPFTVRWPHV